MARTFIGNIRGPKGDPGASIAIDVEYNNTNSGLQAENVQDAIDEIKESIPTKAEDIGADASGSASTALESAKTYTDTKISDLINGAPEAMDTLKEVADAMAENEDVVEALNAAIGNKANTSDLTAHMGDKNNPHGVTTEQIGAVAKTGDNSNTTTTFTQATTRANISTGEKLSVIMGKISKWLTDLKTVAFTGSYTDLSNKPAASDIGAMPSTIISSVTDFNNFTTTGVYHIKFTGAANQPTAHNGTLIVEYDVGTPYQLWLPDNTPIIHKRWYTNSTWSSWVKMNAGTADKAISDGSGKNIVESLDALSDRINCGYRHTLDLSDTSIYNEDTWYPCVGEPIPGNETYTPGFHRIQVNVQLDSNTTPSWSTHRNGFVATMDLLVKARGWGTTNGESICLDYSCNWVSDTSKNPVGYSQLTTSSEPVLWLRGGGKYFIYIDYDTSWNIVTSSYSVNNIDSVSPTTTFPSINSVKSTVWANINGTASSINSGLINPTVSAATHSDYNNNQDLLITRNFMSYWNGAYNGGGKSNLAYCNKGAFGDIVTKKSSDYIGTLILSTTVATNSTATVYTKLDTVPARLYSLILFEMVNGADNARSLLWYYNRCIYSADFSNKTEIPTSGTEISFGNWSVVYSMGRFDVKYTSTSSPTSSTINVYRFNSSYGF